MFGVMKRIPTLLYILSVAAAAQTPYDAPIPRDQPVPDQVRTNRQSYSAIKEVLDRDRVTVSEAQIEELKKHQLEGLWRDGRIQ